MYKSQKGFKTQLPTISQPFPQHLPLPAWHDPQGPSRLGPQRPLQIHSDLHRCGHAAPLHSPDREMALMLKV